MPTRSRRAAPSRYARQLTEPRPIPPRPQSERDRDRVLYSSAFRRLGGITQVAAAGEVALLHNRLTHSLKVAQVGRKIAATVNYLASPDRDRNGATREACLRYGGGTPEDLRSDAPAIDPWVLETAGMIHDLGHPPFGHIAEETLNKLLGVHPNTSRSGELFPRVSPGHDLSDGFEGNAQTFRIVTRLAFGRLAASRSRTAALGLNLTRASLSGTSKYPWLRGSRPEGVHEGKEKWGAYDSEEDVLRWCMQGINSGSQARLRPDQLLEYRSIEAQAMDWADDITYAVHDLEDFARAGLIPLGDLAQSLSRRPPIITSLWEYSGSRLLENQTLVSGLNAFGGSLASGVERQFRRILDALPATATGRRHDRERFRSWASMTIDGLTGLNALSIDPSVGALVIAPSAVLQVEVLKKLTWYFVIDRPAMKSAQRGQEKLIRELFVWLLSWIDDAYQGPEADNPKIPRVNYIADGLPPRLVDFLDIAHWQRSATGGYRTRTRRNSRATTDFIASLTEPQTLDLHNRLSGSSAGSMLSEWFQT